eukprot:4583831-Pyramimonas_sp.AAC.1
MAYAEDGPGSLHKLGDAPLRAEFGGLDGAPFGKRIVMSRWGIFRTMWILSQECGGSAGRGRS